MNLSAMIVPFLLAAVPTIIAITLHEAAHGYAAWALGDPTAKRMGRLSLNPLAHVDRFGTILLPGFLLISQLVTLGRVVFMFGWAKPVPVDATRFRDPRRGMMLVAAAGPAMNYFLAWVAAMALYLLPSLAGSPHAAANVLQFLSYFMLVNIVLGTFNLLPIPPLDGGRIVVGLLPLPLARAWARLERAGIVLVLLVVFLLPTLLSEFGIHFDPVRDLLGATMEPILKLILRLAGNPELGGAMLGDDSDI